MRPANRAEHRWGRGAECLLSSPRLARSKLRRVPLAGSAAPPASAGGRQGGAACGRVPPVGVWLLAATRPSAALPSAGTSPSPAVPLLLVRGAMSAASSCSVRPQGSSGVGWRAKEMDAAAGAVAPAAAAAAVAAVGGQPSRSCPAAASAGPPPAAASCWAAALGRIRAVAGNSLVRQGALEKAALVLQAFL